MTAYLSYPQSDIEPAIDTAELANWLVVPVTDPLLPRIARMASAIGVEYLQRELITRERRVIYQTWPVIGTLTDGLSGRTAKLSEHITLPYAQLLSVEDVAINGEATEDFGIVYDSPVKLRVNPVFDSSDSLPVIDIAYMAGFGDYISSVPQGIRDGLMMLAAYLYEHRGACDVDDAIKKSGAAQMLQPYRFFAVVL